MDPKDSYIRAACRHRTEDMTWFACPTSASCLVDGGPAKHELAGSPSAATGAGLATTPTAAVGREGTVANKKAKRSAGIEQSYRCLACRKIFDEARGFAVHLSKSTICQDADLGCEPYDAREEQLRQLQQRAGEASCV